MIVLPVALLNNSCCACNPFFDRPSVVMLIKVIFVIPLYSPRLAFAIVGYVVSIRFAVGEKNNLESSSCDEETLKYPS